jgi:hypothetical protein
VPNGCAGQGWHEPLGLAQYASPMSERDNGKCIILD